MIHGTVNRGHLCAARFAPLDEPLNLLANAGVLHLASHSSTPLLPFRINRCERELDLASQLIADLQSVRLGLGLFLGRGVGGVHRAVPFHLVHRLLWRHSNVSGGLHHHGIVLEPFKCLSVVHEPVNVLWSQAGLLDEVQPLFRVSLLRGRPLQLDRLKSIPSVVLGVRFWCVGVIARLPERVRRLHRDFARERIE